MAKKKITKKQKRMASDLLPENVLPQNILPVGERVEEDKNIYISQQVYKEIHKFTQNKTTNESGGMLIGNVIEEFGKTNIVIHGFVEAKYCEATPTTLTFTHDTWDYVHKETDKRFSGKKIVGWIHTHPDFGIFLSEYDKFIHQNFFSESYQIAYVVDPIQDIEGFYFWINGKIERCKGFYLFDKTGIKITTGADKDKDTISVKEERLFSFKNLLIALLTIAVVVLLFSNIFLNNKMTTLQNTFQNQQETLVAETNQALTFLQQQITSLSSELTSLKELLTPVVEDDDQPETSTESEEASSQSATTNSQSTTTSTSGSAITSAFTQPTGGTTDE